MRKIFGMSQKDYARKVAAISPCILSQFENGFGNSTLATLEKIAPPFGLRATFLPPGFWRMKGEKEVSAEHGDEGHSQIIQYQHPEIFLFDNSSPS
ncbi:MAG TPA: helix-turn-helix transcriptional regulator, partial [Desulfobacteria bacterium]|nr:helix-turn-helix transcriptional regulator [Desulfobacteria bacterium]